MVIGRWSGVGEGTLVNPFIIDMPVNYDFEEPFHIRLDSNYEAETENNTFFKFSIDLTRTYLLALIVKDVGPALMYYSHKAIAYTMLLTETVDHTDGPFIVSTYKGIHYMLKQQIFSYIDVVDGAIPRYYISSLKPAEAVKGDFWFDIELQPGQTEEQFAYLNSSFIVSVADLVDSDNSPFILENGEIVIDENYVGFTEAQAQLIDIENIAFEIVDSEVVIDENFAEFADDSTEDADAELANKY